jgi:hypothetical protein
MYVIDRPKSIVYTITNQGEIAMTEIETARERVAKVAEAHGEHQFAREVRAGCWDHRNDVQAALRGEKLRGED